MFEDSHMDETQSSEQLRQLIRRDIRSRRQTLSSREQQHAAQCVCQRLLMHPQVKQHRHIALYLSFDGELSTKPLIEALWRQGKQLYLPVLHPFCHGHLLFQQYSAHTPLVANRFNILEPKLNCSQILPANQLDILVMPLVAFDQYGNRLGMGGGFYDRTLSSISNNVTSIGIAHDSQRYPNLPIETWDQPLDCIITPSRLWEWTHKRV
ncbi:5-formyltetrahydrofolate cyclo-ligase [Celerinatantimonas diazotrophica]|uniref:5-formyltetrahydrofolate cyclo-ligase n=1 Tax=Celerinatantimonas diazotrophica TaxID=412034 RepID=A0A4R1J921_9GAMM|nr:5-formyltetrahydrofolate cyclo-ligase [Celerinatantimonas diazotrophica]TCK47000.1 5-formyltetrahydrofolate cyclo-ligase [Celerinatantimonas diazotrophica]CAG9295768.1 5-formyltetrahydrofolate cyclo-ligase [Celerinatantimonas diazotrophica]